jgi:HlyD family secretion protein
MIRVDAARLALEAAEVKSPIDGTVLAVDVDLGQQIAAGSVVAVLADIADVKLTVNVEQRDIRRIQVGQEVDIAIYALPAETFTGVVEQIAPSAGAETGFVTFPVQIRFAEGPVELVLPGMTASANFREAAPAAPAADATPATEAQATATPVTEEEATATPAATPEATASPEPTATPGN